MLVALVHTGRTAWHDAKPTAKPTKLSTEWQNTSNGLHRDRCVTRQNICTDSSTAGDHADYSKQTRRHSVLFAVQSANQQRNPLTLSSKIWPVQTRSNSSGSTADCSALCLPISLGLWPAGSEIVQIPAKNRPWTSEAPAVFRPCCQIVYFNVDQTWDWRHNTQC